MVGSFVYEALRIFGVLDSDYVHFDTLVIIIKVGKAIRIKARTTLLRVVRNEHDQDEEPFGWFENKMVRITSLSLDKIRLLPRLALLLLDSLLVPMAFWLLVPDSFAPDPNSDYYHALWIVCSAASLVLSITVVYFYRNNNLSSNKQMRIIATACTTDAVFRVYCLGMSILALVEPARFDELFCEIAGPVGIFLASAVALWNTAIALNLCALLAFPMRMQHINMTPANHALCWFGAAFSSGVYAVWGKAQRSTDGFCMPDGRNFFTYSLPLAVCLFFLLSSVCYCMWKLEGGEVIVNVVESNLIFVTAWGWALLYFFMHTSEDPMPMSDTPWLVFVYIFFVGSTGAQIGYVWLSRMGRVVQGRSKMDKGEIMIQHSFNIATSTLFVGVQQARRLPAADNNGLSDPYVILALIPSDREAAEAARVKTVPGNKSVARTRTIKRTLNPSWNQEFELKLSLESAMAGATLMLRVYDWDLGSSDDALGEVVLTELNRAKAAPKWYPLVPCTAPAQDSFSYPLRIATTPTGPSARTTTATLDAGRSIGGATQHRGARPLKFTPI